MIQIVKERCSIYSLTHRVSLSNSFYHLLLFFSLISRESMRKGKMIIMICLLGNLVRFQALTI